MEEDKKTTAAICRVCLCSDFQRVDGKGVSLFEVYNDCVISNKINALANVGIKEGDGLPDRICPECLLELENAFKFKLKCERTNEVLLTAVNEAPTFEGYDEDLIEDVLKIKEEFLDHVDIEYEELVDNHTADLIISSRSGSLETEQPVAAPPKPSKAIDLKLLCHDCGGSFKSKCKLRVHWKKMHFTENLKCLNCLRKFKSFAALKSHKKQNLISCVVATKVHIEGEGKSRIFYCKECNYHSKRIENMRMHIAIHSGDKPFQCDLCLKYFTQIASLLSHKESVHKLYRTEGTCDHCGKHLKGRSRLYKHIQTHNNKSSYPCNICQVVLKTKNNLKVHMKKHSGVKAYSCEICPASFYHSSGLWSHKEKVHIKSRQYTCDVCKYKTLSSTQIKKHKVKHTASNFGCNVCGIVVENMYQLELHQKRHTDRNFPCPHCDKTYYSGRNLSAHIRDKHRFVMLTGTPASNNRPATSKSVKRKLSGKC